MKLNRERLIKNINEKWKRKNCPMCEKNNWFIDENIVTVLKVDDKKDVKIGEQFDPLVSFTCMECGNVLFVNPLVIGALEDTGETEI